MCDKYDGPFNSLLILFIIVSLEGQQVEIKFFVRKFYIARVWEMSRNIRRRERPGFLGRERFRVIVEQTETEETDEWTLWRWNTGTVHCAPPVPLSVQTARIPSVLERHAGHFSHCFPFFFPVSSCGQHTLDQVIKQIWKIPNLFIFYLLHVYYYHYYWIMLILLILSCWSKFDINWIKFNNSD